MQTEIIMCTFSTFFPPFIDDPQSTVRSYQDETQVTEIKSTSLTQYSKLALLDV